MDELTADERGAVDGLVSGALAPLIELLANDVEFEVAGGGDAPSCRKHSGQQAVADYFDGAGRPAGVLADGRIQRERRAGDRVGGGELHGGGVRARGCDRVRAGVRPPARQGHQAAGDRGSVIHSRLGLSCCVRAAVPAGVRRRSHHAFAGRVRTLHYSAVSRVGRRLWRLLTRPPSTSPPERPPRCPGRRVPSRSRDVGARGRRDRSRRARRHTTHPLVVPKNAWRLLQRPEGASPTPPRRAPTLTPRAQRSAPTARPGTESAARRAGGRAGHGAWPAGSASRRVPSGPTR